MRAFVAIRAVTFGFLVAACGMAPKGSPPAHGVAIDPGPRPSADDCARIIRADLEAAKRIRADLHLDGLPSDDAALRAAAADPGADLSTLGIPLFASEVNAIGKSGIALDEHDRLAILVHSGAPERFGGIWIDPPGTDRYVVAVVGPDPATLARARCVEGANTNYVTARISLEAGLAIQSRVNADWQALAAQGIKLATTSYDETKGVVIVGVTGLTEDIRRRLTEKYGDIVVEEQGPLVPT